MKKQRWQDWGNVVLGLWIFVSPSVIQHTMTSGEYGTTTAAAMVVTRVRITSDRLAAANT